jgi:hypothetical protein
MAAFVAGTPGIVAQRQGSKKQLCRVATGFRQVDLHLKCACGRIPPSRRDRIQVSMRRTHFNLNCCSQPFPEDVPLLSKAITPIPLERPKSAPKGAKYVPHEAAILAAQFHLWIPMGGKCHPYQSDL